MPMPKNGKQYGPVWCNHQASGLKMSIVIKETIPKFMTSLVLESPDYIMTFILSKSGVKGHKLSICPDDYLQDRPATRISAEELLRGVVSTTEIQQFLCISTYLGVWKISISVVCLNIRLRWFKPAKSTRTLKMWLIEHSPTSDTPLLIAILDTIFLFSLRLGSSFWWHNHKVPVILIKHLSILISSITSSRRFGRH